MKSPTEKNLYAHGNTNTCAHTYTLIDTANTEPWLHAGFFVTGAYLTSIYDGFEQQLLNEVNQTRKEKGLPPIVKNNSMWFPLQEAEVDGKQE